jgi:hypothetical protein
MTTTQFGVIFESREVKVLDSEAVRVFSDFHNGLNKKDINVAPEVLIAYLGWLWDFVAFVRSDDAHGLRTTQPLVFGGGSFESNCYCWGILLHTTELAELVLSERPAEEFSDEKDQAKRILHVKQTLGLVNHCLDECIRKWHDRGDNETFRKVISAMSTKLANVYRPQLRCRALVTHAWFSSTKGEDFALCAAMYASAHALGDKEAQGRAMVYHSMSLNQIAEYGEAIGWAKAYEKKYPGAVHPELKKWNQANASVYKQKVAEITDKQIADMPLSDSYQRGQIPKRTALYQRIVNKE